MTSRRIMILAALGVAASAYFIFFKDRDDFLYVFSISLIILMLSYIFQHQIDHLMSRGVPQVIDAPMAAMLMQSSPQFAAMSETQRLLVMDRMKRWVIRKEFINKNEQDAPEDVKYILAYYAVLLTIHQESFLYEQFDRVVFYHHPFLSPAHDEEVHIVELEKTDGTIILSVPHLLKGHLEKGYYNIALHAIAAAYRYQYLPGDIRWPAEIKEQLQSISSIPYTRIEDYVGLPIDDPFPVAVHHQVTYLDADIPIITEIFPQLKGQ